MTILTNPHDQPNTFASGDLNLTPAKLINRVLSDSSILEHAINIVVANPDMTVKQAVKQIRSAEKWLIDNPVKLP